MIVPLMALAVALGVMVADWFDIPGYNTPLRAPKENDR